MKNRDKLKKILGAISPDETREDFKLFDEEVKRLKQSLRTKVEVKTLDDVKSTLEKFKKNLDVSGLESAVARLEERFGSKSDEITSAISDALNELSTLSKQGEDNNKKEQDGLRKLITSLGNELARLGQSKDAEIEALAKEIFAVREDKTLQKSISKIEERIKEARKMSSDEKTLLKADIKDLEEKLDELRRDMLTKLAERGGGAMNRQFFVGGVDPLLRYTDINLKAGANVTITYANNNTTKKTEITIAGTGGGSGITRIITSIAANTTAAATASVDYVYLCSGTTTLTLPTAVGNSNLYTVKNVGVGTITIDTTSSQTIDGDLTVVMPVRYTSVDLISDTANWNVT